jgi:hypothetical protein
MPRRKDNIEPEVLSKLVAALQSHKQTLAADLLANTWVFQTKRVRLMQVAIIIANAETNNWTAVRIIAQALSVETSRR